MSHLRTLEVLNTVIDREEEEEGYNVVRSWLEGDMVLVNISSFTEVRRTMLKRSLILKQRSDSRKGRELYQAHL
jgi:hypothetical protein